MTSKIKVDNINKVSDDSNIINKCGTNITMGANGDTVIIPNGVTEQVQSGGAIQVQSGGSDTIASGASITNSGTATGFGQSYNSAFNWQTTPKTATFVPVNGEGYFINSGSALTANLPAGSAGAIVAFSDYARNFQTYNFTISPNGTDKIGGIAEDATLNINGQSATFVYVDATKGWVNVQNAEDTETGAPPYIEATGGAESFDGNFKIHTFTGPGTFQVTKLATVSPAPIYNIVSYVVAAGGGSGGGTGSTTHVGGGGGAGGVRAGKNAPVDTYTSSPLACTSGPNAGLPVSVTSYTIQVGGGGTSPGSGPATGGPGVDSTFSTITSTGGGGGGSLGSPSIPRNGNSGGSGGGGSSQVAGSGGSGNSPPVSPPQGQPGGGGTDAPPDLRGGSGGGATAAGTGGSPTANQAAGGAGATTNISGSPVGYSGGGGSGATSGGGPGAGGAASPCGSGASGAPGSSTTGPNAPDNRAGGGGGAGGTGPNPGDTLGGNGGSGVVIIRYRYQ